LVAVDVSSYLIQGLWIDVISRPVDRNMNTPVAMEFC
jgi:hypothetical protein